MPHWLALPLFIYLTAIVVSFFNVFILLWLLPVGPVSPFSFHLSDSVSRPLSVFLSPSPFCLEISCLHYLPLSGLHSPFTHNLSQTSRWVCQSVFSAASFSQCLSKEQQSALSEFQQITTAVSMSVCYVIAKINILCRKSHKNIEECPRPLCRWHDRHVKAEQFKAMKNWIFFLY